MKKFLSIVLILQFFLINSLKIVVSKSQTLFIKYTYIRLVSNFNERFENIEESKYLINFSGNYLEQLSKNELTFVLSYEKLNKEKEIIKDVGKYDASKFEVDFINFENNISCIEKKELKINLMDFFLKEKNLNLHFNIRCCNKENETEICVDPLFNKVESINKETKEVNPSDKNIKTINSTNQSTVPMIPVTQETNNSKKPNTNTSKNEIKIKHEKNNYSDSKNYSAELLSNMMKEEVNLNNRLNEIVSNEFSSKNENNKSIKFEIYPNMKSDTLTKNLLNESDNIDNTISFL